MASSSVLSLQFIGALLPSFSDEIMSAVLGASLAFLFSWLLQRSAEKKSRALDLIKEYSSPEFIDIRNDAGKAIRIAFEEFQKNKNTNEYPSWKTLFDKFNDEHGSNSWRKISKVKHFFEKLNYLVKIREVNLNYISGYFYPEFTHWNKRYFSNINNASKLENTDVELDITALEKKLKDQKSTIFLPFNLTTKKLLTLNNHE